MGKVKTGLPQTFEVPRSLAVHQEGIELYFFGDASANRVATCVYAVVHQAAWTNQGLIAARLRLSKHGSARLACALNMALGAVTCV